MASAVVFWSGHQSSVDRLARSVADRLAQPVAQTGEEGRMMRKKAAVVALAGLALGVSPARAGSIGNAETVALSMIASAGLMSLGCYALALNTEEVDEGYARRGFFVGAAASYARQNFSDSSVVNLVDGELQDNLQQLRETGAFTPNSPPDDPLPGVYTVGLTSLDNDVWAGGGRGGYRCHPYVATELQFERLANFKGSLMETDIPTNDKVRSFDLKLQPLVVTSNAKGYLLTGRYQPYVLGGVGFMRMDAKSFDTTTTPGTIAGFAGHASNLEVRVALRFGAGLDFYVTDNIVMTAEGSYLMPTGKLDGLDYYSFGLGMQYRF
jgi:opacity protein-like surface antigen